MRPLKVLLYSPYFGGHYIEYVLHLSSYVESNRELVGSIELTVILPQECEGDVLEFKDPMINFVYLENPLQRYGNVPVEQQLEILESTCQSREIDVVFFPHMERAIHVLRRLRLKGVLCSGIIFTTLNRFGFPNENLFKRLYRSTRFLGRRLLDTYRMLSGKKWAHVFLLNDKDAPGWYRKLPFLDVKSFSSIVDPVELSPLPPKDLYSRSDYGLSESKPVVACVGDLRERKNVHTLVEAFSILEKQGSDVQFLIVGSGDKEYTKRIRAMIDAKSLSNVHFHDRYPEDEEFRWIVDNADVIAIPYVDFFRSSGVLNHAIQARTSILCGNVGLIFDAVNQCKLGVGVNPNDPKDIARGLEILTDDFQISDQRIDEFVKANDPAPEKFAEAVISKLVATNS